MRGINRSKEFRYVGIINNPLEDFQNASAINNIRTYAQFCEDSAGFFPCSWLEYFFEDTLDLLKINQIKKNGEQIISSSIDRELTNIHLLPFLYETIRNKHVLSINYKPYDEELVTLEFHPHLLKEHNGRWFLFGHAEGKEPNLGYNLALDRISGEPIIIREIDKYESAPKGFYDNFFQNIVGVSHGKDETPVTIVVRATNHKVFKLVETKKIHHSQQVIRPFALYDDGEYGEFKLFVEINNEFIGRILQMGDGLVVVSPTEIKNIFKQRVEKLAKFYE
jgi:predicted DNA-binding transcriptional regulator YafY